MFYKNIVIKRNYEIKKLRIIIMLEHYNNL